MAITVYNVAMGCVCKYSAEPRQEQYLSLSLPLSFTFLDFKAYIIIESAVDIIQKREA